MWLMLKMDSHPSLSSWCEGNVDESSVVLGPLPCNVSSILDMGHGAEAGGLDVWIVEDIGVDLSRESSSSS